MGFPRDIERALLKLPKKERQILQQQAFNAALTRIPPADRARVKGLIEQVESSVTRMGIVSAIDFVSKSAIAEAKRVRKSG